MKKLFFTCIIILSLCVGRAEAQCNVIITNPDAVCFPTTVDLTAAAVTFGSTPGLTFTYWTDPSATISYPTPTAATDGIYYIKGDNLIDCFEIIPVTVTVNSPPTTPGTIGGTATQCAGLTGQVYSITAVAGATTYTWTVPTGWSVTGGAGTTSITVTTGSAGQNGNITVTAGNSCGTSTPSSLAVTVNPGTPATPGAITGTAAQCAGLTGQTYSIATVTGASTYTWTVPTGWSVTSGAGTTSITVTTGSSGQNGNITVTAGNGCGTSSPRSLAVTVNPGTPATPGSITGTAAQCAGLTGQIYSIAAVTGASTYTWTVPTGWSITGGAGTTSITVTTGSSGQNGNITVTAGNSCGTSLPVSLAVTVNPGAPATPGTITGTAAQCPGLSGQIYSITAVPGASAYTWTVPTGWSITGGAGTTSITVTTGSSGQNGNITVTAGNGCGTSSPASLAVTVNPGTPATPGAITGTAAQCPGLTGQIYSITAVTGASAYTWTVPAGWSITGGAGTTSITVTTGSAGQNGNIKVTADNSCGASLPGSLAVTVNPGTPATPGTITGTTAQCAGLTGQIYSIAAVTGASTYTWTVPAGWSVTGGAGTTSIIVTAGSSGQNGNITVTAGNSCGTSSLRSLAVTVNQGTPATPGTITGTVTQCAGLTGQIYSIAAVTGASTYTWTVPTGWSLTGGAGTTSITVTTGSAGQNGNITVTAGNLCGTSSESVLSITVLASPTATISGTIAVCQNAADPNITFTNPQALPITITYNINGSNQSTINVGASTTANLAASTNAAGTFAYNLVSAAYQTGPACSKSIIGTATVTINPTPIPTLTSSAPGNVSCAGTNVTFTAGGGTNYSFRINGFVKQNGPSNIYSTNTLNNGDNVDVIVTNANGCTATSASILNFVNPLPFFIVTTPPTCSTNYATYSLAVTVSAGTVTSTSGTVGNVGGNVWTISGILAGVNISVTVTNGGCAYSQTVTAPDCSCPIILPPISGGNKSYCAGGIIPSLTMTVPTGGNPKTVDWYNASGTILSSGNLSYTPSSAGIYYATTREISSGCVSSTRTADTLTMNPLPIATLTSSDADNIFCAGTSVTFTAGSGTNYNFRVAGVSIQNGVLATFTTTTLTNGQIVDVIVTNALGCTATSAGITNTVNALPVPTLTSSVATNNFCLGTSVTFTAGGGTNYNFRVGGLSVQNGASATYTTTSLTNGQVVDVIVTNANGCTATSSAITNSVFTIPTIDAGTGGNNCGLSFHLNGTLSSGTGTWTKVSGPGNASFSPDANTANAVVTVTAYGSYTFRWTVVNGTCSASATVTVTFIQQPPANGGAGGSSCDKSFVMTAVVTAGTGTWTKITGPGNAIFTPDNQQPNATVTVDQFGTYTFGWTVVNSICTSSDVITVAFHDLPAVSAGRDTTTCKGSSVQLNAVGAGTVSWIPVAFVSNPDIVNPIATPDTTTTFTVNLTDQFGCKNSASIIIEVRDKIVADAGPDQTLGYVFTATLAAKIAHSYETGVWRLISGTGEIVDSTAANTTVNGLAVGDNKLLWTVSNGFCPPSRDTLIISVINFEIPTLITPNMDGRNDYFVLRGLSTLGKTELIIFDRRGVQVYRNTNYDNTWDGVDYNKKPLPDDTYFYIIRTANGKSFRGYIVIRR
jgi:gliding motility-associated-like protein